MKDLEELELKKSSKSFKAAHTTGVSYGDT